MLGNSLLLVFGGCLLGAVQLLVGIAIGIWVRRPQTTADEHDRNEMQQAGAIAKRLQTLAGEMSSIVDEHCSELEQASQLLTVDGVRRDESIANLVMNVIGNIVHANQSLQSKLDTAESRLEEQAVEIEAHISRSLTDALTGLPNRREFNERLEERMSAWNRRREPFSLLLLDVDHFKKLNDVYGHLLGDQVLAALGEALRGAIRREDAIARYGGEEFAILLPNTLLEQASLVAQKVREAAIHATVRHNQTAIAITVSGGLATIQPNEAVERLIQRADAALYAAKAAGRNCAFAHDGTESRLADGRLQAAPSGTAAKLVDLINSPDAEKPPTNGSSHDGSPGFGNYLPRETISTALAETCKELRQFLENRSQSDDVPSSVRPA